jgi:hypothetical protein
MNQQIPENSEFIDTPANLTVSVASMSNVDADRDAIILLKDWLDANLPAAPDRITRKWQEIDTELELSEGTARRLLPAIVQEFDVLDMDPGETLVRITRNIFVGTL